MPLLDFDVTSREFISKSNFDIKLFRKDRFDTIEANLR